MKTMKTLGYGFALLLLTLTVLTLVPEGAAQAGAQLTVTAKDVKTTIPGNSGRLAPETQIAEVKYTFNVAIPDIGGQAGLAVCPTATVIVTFVPAKPGDWATITLTPQSATVTLTPNGQTRNQDVQTTMQITTTRKARAFVSDTYSVKASATAGGAQGCTFTPSNEAKADASIQNDYIPILEYSPARYIQKTGQNKEVAFPIEITNFGNAQTKVQTKVSQPNKNKLDAVVPPSDTTLNSELESKTDVKKTIVVAARTPHANGYTNNLYSFIAEFTGTATTPGQEIGKDTQQVTLSVQVQGVYVPGFDFTSIAGALAIGLGIMGIARRRLG